MDDCIRQIALLLTALLLSVSTYTDLKYRIIPNVLTIPVMLAGVASDALLHASVRYSLEGIAAAILIYLLPTAFGVAGGGDMKLAAVLGALWGTAGVLGIMLVAHVLAGVYVLVRTALKRATGKDAVSVRQMLSERVPMAPAYLVGMGLYIANGGLYR